MRMIRTRDVIFDHTRFYDSTDIDLTSVLSVKEMMKCLEMFESIFVEIVIEEENDLVDEINLEISTDLYINMKINHSTEDVQKMLNDVHTDVKTETSLTSELLSEPTEQITEIQSITENVQSTSEPFESSRSRREQRADPPADSMTMNTRSRKQTYAATLTIVSDLTSYYEAFIASMKRPSVEKIRLHRDSLPEEPRY
jgi:hypothetical protein